jgi:amino-acid N-acetyltransferase
VDFERACPEQLPAVRALLRTSGLPEADLSAGHMSDFLVARNGLAVQACVGIERFGDVALVRSLCVSAQDRGTGCGSRALRAVEQHARAAGVHHLYLLTTTAPEYFRARGYRRCDRTAVPSSIGATPEFEALCPSSATCLSKVL